MPRIAIVVAPGFPHHITQRGNRRQPTFFSDDDYAAYIDLMAEWCSQYGVEVWAYCLMPNHVHLVSVPQKKTACTLPLEKRIGDIRVWSISGKAGVVICGRVVLLHM